MDLKGGVNMYKNKRGLSEVVTAIIVILLVLVAIGIIWVVVSNLLNQGASEAEGGVECITTQISIESATKVDGPDTDTIPDSYNVVVTRGTGGPDTITNIKLVFGDGTKSETEDKTVNIPELGKETVTVLLTDITTLSDIAGQPAGSHATKVSVAAIIDGRTCEPSSKTNIA